jgi:hypothetical protein
MVISIGLFMVHVTRRSFGGCMYNAFTSSGYRAEGSNMMSSMPLFSTENNLDGKTKRALCAYVKQK